MERCQSYHGNKMKLGNGKMPKVETVLDDDDDTVTHTYFLDKPADKTTMPEQDVIDKDRKPIHGLHHIVDPCNNMEVKLPHQGKELYGSVVGLCLDKNGKMIANSDPNRYLNTVLYHIKFKDGTTAAYGGNIIAENMRRMFNNEGYHEDTLHSIVDIRFSPCKADPDIQMRKAKRVDNFDYWEYVLLYVDDCLAIFIDPEPIVRDKIRKYFLMREASIGEPGVYLRGKVRKVELDTGELCWAFSSSQYVQEACWNV